MKIHNSTKFIPSFSGWIDTQYLPTDEDQKPFLYHYLWSCFVGPRLETLQADGESPREGFILCDRLLSDCVTGHLKTHFFHVVFQWLSSTGGFSLEAKRKRGWQGQEREKEEWKKRVMEESETQEQHQSFSIPPAALLMFVRLTDGQLLIVKDFFFQGNSNFRSHKHITT